MRATFALLMLLVSVGCSQPELIPDDQFIEAFPEAAKIPDCGSLDPERRDLDNHLLRNGGYEDTAYFTGSRECLNSWNEAFGKNEDHRGELYFLGNEQLYLTVMRSGDETAPEGDAAFVKWLHDKPIPGAVYWSGGGE